MQLLQSVTATLCSEESSQWQCQFSTDTEPAILAIQFFLVGEFICYCEAQARVRQGWQGWARMGKDGQGKGQARIVKGCSLKGP